MRDRKKPPRLYRNPIILAKQYQQMIQSGIVKSQAELARLLGVSRVRVHQMLRLLQLDLQVIREIEELGDPLPSPVITERRLRQYIGNPRA